MNMLTRLLRPDSEPGQGECGPLPRQPGPGWPGSIGETWIWLYFCDAATLSNRLGVTTPTG